MPDDKTILKSSDLTPAYIANPETFTVKDSGKRQDYENGAVRDITDGKGSFISISPVMLKRLSKHLELGMKKYTMLNYTKGIPTSRCFDSAMRHLVQAIDGQKDEDHLSAVIFNLMVVMHNETYFKDNLKIHDVQSLTPWKNETQKI